MKKQKQSFVVLGLGRFGSSVARSLCELGHEVLAVDRDEKLVENIAPDVTQAVQANAVDEDALAELGVQNFDAAIVAIGTDIRASILATVLLKEAGVPKVLAKAVDDLHARVLYKVGADRVIFPERDMGQRVARSLVAPNILDLMALSDDDGDQGAPLARAVQDAEEGEVAQDAVAASGAVTTLANPWQECANMAQAESLAGFSFAIDDSALPEGYSREASYIQVIEGEMLEVDYNGERGGSVCLRKAVGTDDVSGDYNSYDLTQTSCIAGQDVTLRGAENAWYVATWTSDGYSFAVVSTSALTTSQVEALVARLR